MIKNGTVGQNGSTYLTSLSTNSTCNVEGKIVNHNCGDEKNLEITFSKNNNHDCENREHKIQIERTNELPRLVIHANKGTRFVLF